MFVMLSTELDAPADAVWREVCRPRLLRYVSAPFQTFDAVEPPEWPEVWRGGTYHVRLRLLGVVPLGEQAIVLAFPAVPATPGPERYELHDQGHGRLAHTWDHLITVQARPDGRTTYRDRVEVRAGLLTPLVWLFAQAFHRHRQRRWRTLVRQRFRYPESEGSHWHRER